MAYQTWMAGVLRGAGLAVREIAGWQSRGHGSMGSVLGVVAHHTAGGARGDFPSERVVVNGRTGLPGPLCNLGLTRSGTWVVVAAGQAYHAGSGSAPWCPSGQGNSRLLGVEAESVGTRDDWTAAQRESYPRGVAALLRYCNLPAARVIGHKEWAPSRKIDPAFWEMHQFRTATARWIAAPTTRPTAPTQEDPFMALTDAQQGEILEAARSVLFGIGGVRNAGPMALKLDTVSSDVAVLRRQVDTLASRPAGQVDVAAIVDAIVRQGLAKQIADELARRLTA